MLIRKELTCPCRFIITTVLLLLHTTKCSGFFEKLCILLTVISLTPNALMVLTHSVVFMLHTFTVPSDDALKYKST